MFGLPSLIGAKIYHSLSLFFVGGHTQHKKMKKTIIIVEFLSYIFMLACFIFVMYQGCQCLSKYLGNPKSTDIKIDLASKHSYPAVTICFESGTSIFDPILHECNLTFNDYFVGNKWIGNQSIEICRRNWIGNWLNYYLM